MFGTGIDVQQRIEQGGDGQQQEQEGEGQRYIAEKILGVFTQVRHQVETELNHQ
ncbi:hypothetical protein D3C71_2073360 [compost metagenome]